MHPANPDGLVPRGANSADELVLFDDKLLEVDRVEWDGGPSFPDPNGASMALKDPGADNNVGANGATSLAAFGAGDSGTPSQCNRDVGEVCASSVPEPATTALLAMGAFAAVAAAGLGNRRRGRLPKNRPPGVWSSQSGPAA